MVDKKAARSFIGLDPKEVKIKARMRKEEQLEEGFAGGNLIEPVPKFKKLPCEHVIANKNNSWIVLGRDRPSHEGSGYGGKGDTQAGSIDIVVGRMAPQPLSSARVNSKDGGKADEPVELHPIFVEQPTPKKFAGLVENTTIHDAARIYISQKTDVDDNFKLIEGKVGNAKAKSAIAIKADGIRILAREGIKLITGADKHNSYSVPLTTIPGIDLIAGNIDSGLQPLAKGDNLKNCLTELIMEIEDLNSIVMGFITTQIKMNYAFANHTHISPFYAFTVPMSVSAMQSGLDGNIRLGTKSLRSLINQMSNLENAWSDYVSPNGIEYICSRYNNTN